jgi:hypothetical protein
MVIFKFIDDKDVFQKFYQKKLAQRLISSASASDDSESSMITKLKELSGFDYTNKLMKMFQGELEVVTCGSRADVGRRRQYRAGYHREVQEQRADNGRPKRW